MSEASRLKPEIVLIAAMAENRVIGKDGGLPWHLPRDLRRFKNLTMGHTVVMGRRTFESVDKQPLPGRRNIILTNESDYDAGEAAVVADIDKAIALATREEAEILFVCGGQAVYRALLPLADRMELTIVHTTIEGGDAHFPEFDASQWILIRETEHGADDRNAFAITDRSYRRA